MKKRFSVFWGLFGAALVLAWLAASTSPAQTGNGAALAHVPVVFAGGFDTDGRDGGRPVVLIAAALGVPPEVFRDAFSHVRPAPAGTAPEPAQVRQNKAALMAALAPYGVTNERLDAVSNFYRYVRSRGEHWPAKPASAYALVADGKVTGFVVTDGGSGYSSPPSVTVTVTSVSGFNASVRLAFGKDFAVNGSVAAITMVPQ